MDHLVLDIETTGLDWRKHSTIHCITTYHPEKDDSLIFGDKKLGADYRLEEAREYMESFSDYQLIGQNHIGFDLPYMRASMGFEYQCAEWYGEMDSFLGNPCEIIDTKLYSQMLNPDRYGGHGLEALSKGLVTQKKPYEKLLKEQMIAKGASKEDIAYAMANIWAIPTALMYEYCRDDGRATWYVYQKLMKEAGDWDYSKCYWIEKSTADLVTSRGQHLGFKVDRKKCQEVYDALKKEIDEIESEISSILPATTIPKKDQDFWTPPAKQINKDGSISKHMENWMAKVEAEFLGHKIRIPGHGTHKLPLPHEPVIDIVVPSTSKTHDVVKPYLLTEYKWDPDDDEWNMRDLCQGATRNDRRTPEQFITALKSYIEDTRNSAYGPFRCRSMGYDSWGEMAEGLIKKAKQQKLNKRGGLPKPIKVPTTPWLKNPQTKAIVDTVEALAEKHEWVKRLVRVNTLHHRLLVLENESSGGWKNNERVLEEGWIDTPAITCGTSTHRFKHRQVANVPNMDSLYGPELRGCLKAPAGWVMLGSDADGLEARVQADKVFDYDPGGHYIKSLLQDKVGKEDWYEGMTVDKLDVHQQTAVKMFNLTVEEVVHNKKHRSTAKGASYAAAYGCAGKRMALITNRPESEGDALLDAYWAAAQPLADYRDTITEYFKAHGFIVLADGSKGWPRSSHSVVNLDIQNTGAQAAKVAACYVDRKTREEGLTCNLAIIYHDEYEFMVPQSDCEFKSFTTKEEALNFRKEEMEQGKRWSEPFEKKGKYWVSYSRAGEIMSEAWDFATKFLGLRVPLTGSYACGKTWACVH